jgi:hypothetical protein
MGFQTRGFNFAVQYCDNFCVHPEWIMIGAGFIATAVFGYIWRR